MIRSILTLRGFWLCLVLVPLFFVMQHMGPDGVPAAQGCGGGGNYVPTKYVEISGPAGEGGAPETAAGNIAVATDGFFLMNTNVGTDPEALSVRVTTADEVVVPGTVKVFNLVDTGTVHYTWSANEALTVGTQLKVVMSPSGMPELASEAELEVVAAPAEVSVGELTVESWIDIGHGTGPLVSCTVSATCKSTTEQVSTGPEELLHAANYVWLPPRIDGFVLWQVEVEHADGASGLSEAGPVIYTDRDPFGAVLVTYPKASDRYCAKVTVRDLRTGLEQAREQCFELGAAAQTWHYLGLSRCSEAPAGFEGAWCKAHVDDPRCVSMPGPSQPGSAQPDPMAAPVRNESSGCQLSMGASRATCFGLFVTAVALAGLLRRRRSNPAPEG